jgi:hypothetical protein
MRAPWIIAFLLLPTAPAAANDSSASMGAGGLVYTTSSLIEIQRETLVIGENEVRVSYDFLNTGKDDISTLVAFPLPDLDFNGDWNYHIDSPDPVNWIGFHVSADGKELTPQVEARATSFGIDVTDVLNRYGLPITMLNRSSDQMDVLEARLKALPPEARAELLRYGVVDWTSSWGADNVPYPTMHWTSHIAFYWFQTFPAGKTLHVEHRYRPVPGLSFVTPEALDESYVKDSFCIDPAARKKIETRIRAEPDEMMRGAELRYVVSTGSNWLGPIGHFSLRIEKGAADNMVASCWKGLAPSGADALVFEADNFQPDEDLRFLLVRPLERD